MREGRNDERSERERLADLELDVDRMRGAWHDWLPLLILLQDREAERSYNLTATIAHALIVVALIAAAVTLEVTGNDATPAWAALGAYPAGAAIQKAAGS